MTYIIEATHKSLDKAMEKDALGTLRTMNELKSLIDTWAEKAVTIARREGASWAVIGDALNITKQAAHQRYAEPPVCSVCGGPVSSMSNSGDSIVRSYAYFGAEPVVTATCATCRAAS